MFGPSRRVAVFIAVGSVSALVHMVVVLALVEWQHLHPLLANVAGWMTAFVVSFIGHFNATFRSRDLTWPTAARRYGVVSAAGFTVNQLSYAAALHWTAFRYDGLLALVLVVVAVLTYLASRAWAFRGTPHRP